MTTLWILWTLVFLALYLSANGPPVRICLLAFALATLLLLANWTGSFDPRPTPLPLLNL